MLFFPGRRETAVPCFGAEDFSTCTITKQVDGTCGSPTGAEYRVSCSFAAGNAPSSEYKVRLELSFESSSGAPSYQQVDEQDGDGSTLSFQFDEQDLFTFWDLNGGSETFYVQGRCRLVHKAAGQVCYDIESSENTESSVLTCP